MIMIFLFFAFSFHSPLHRPNRNPKPSIHSYTISGRTLVIYICLCLGWGAKPMKRRIIGGRTIFHLYSPHFTLSSNLSMLIDA